ncbi:toll/interleukin-1 receptor domain-containing protein, partial [Bacillus sp. JJ1521]|uniref:toll/interleukin-1 receptor domain-containing protein n=1 Tax=Bacillus sp. JJ1521 TaxID=3122957 RepID=UPI0030004140
RGFNSYPILDSGDLIFIFNDGFWFRSPEEVPSEEYFKEYFLEHLKSEGYNAFNKMAGGTTLFISHSSRQKESLEKIIPYYTSIDELIWLDKYRITEDAEPHIVEREIAKGLNEANKVLFFITKEFLKSKWCTFELELAKKIYEEKDDYRLSFIIDEDVMKYFFEVNKELVNSIVKNDILILYKHQDLEEHIKKILKK